MSKSTKPKAKVATVTTSHTMPCGLIISRSVNPHDWGSYVAAGRSIAQEGLDHALGCAICGKRTTKRKEIRRASGVEIA